MISAERTLQAECAWRLQTAPLAAIWIPIPNGLFVPARTEAEKRIVQRIIARMKSDGMLRPGAYDLVFLWDTGCGAVELKRPAERTLFGRVPAGRLSDDQIYFATMAAQQRVRYALCDSWDALRLKLVEWERLPEGWGNAAAR